MFAVKDSCLSILTQRVDPPTPSVHLKEVARRSSLVVVSAVAAVPCCLSALGPSRLDQLEELSLMVLSDIGVLSPL